MNEQKEYLEDMMRVRKIYEMEKKMLHYLREGDEAKMLNALKDVDITEFKRFPNEPVRNIKNLLITLNTLFRKTVSQNAIEPYLIHRISEKFAIKIELAKTVEEVHSLLPIMVRDYCNLINQFLNQGYSSLIVKATQYIRLHYEQDLSLQEIAKLLYVHPNYLSKKFKAETGHSLTDYINHVRVWEAQYMLKETEAPIAEIAYAVGFNDTKYFSKVFKKITQKTPSEFRENS